MEESNSRISYLPTDGLTYDPSDSNIGIGSTDKEIERTFEICHGAECVLNTAIPFQISSIFWIINTNGDVKKIKPEDTIQIMDACFQCKLCEVQCPYTIRDGHEFKLDFPNWYIAIKQSVPKKARTLRDKILGNPDKSAEWHVPVLD